MKESAPPPPLSRGSASTAPAQNDVAGVGWIFGYGSLMWRPDFPYRERRPALLRGYHRAFCRLSFRHRGTRERPGMVVGLAPGGDCLGYAFMPEPRDLPAVMVKLDEREGAGYRRLALPVEFQIETPPHPASQPALRKPAEGSPEVERAYAYVPVPSHPSHAPALAKARVVELIATGVGESGRASEYLRELVATLRRMEIPDPALEDMLVEVERFNGPIHPPLPGKGSS